MDKYGDGTGGSVIEKDYGIKFPSGCSPQETNE
jgi:hypothetical protein